MGASGLFHRSMVLIWMILFLFLTPVLWAEVPSLPFTPVGDSASVEELKFRPDGGETFPDKSGERHSRDVSGESWSFSFPWKDRDQGREELVRMLKAKDAEILSDTDDEIAVRIKESPQRILWMKFFPERDGCKALFIRETVLREGEALTFVLDREVRETFIFYTEHPGDKYLRLDATCEKADIDFKGKYERRFGELRHNVDYNRVCYRVHGPRYELSDIPQFRGRILWTVEIRDGEDRQEVSVSLVPGPSLPLLKKGDALGGILLRNVPFGHATALPEFDGSYEYPGFTKASLEGDRTPTGEAVFWLPPGLWKLRVDPRKQKGITYLESHMIPVQPGRTTIVDWPPSIAEALVEEGTGRLEILKAEAGKKQGSVEISLVGEERKKVVPTSKNLSVTESGAEAKILSVERMKTPLDVVLLLDSSGSMKGRMKEALKATAAFIKGFPEDARIKVIDFDTKPRIIPAKGRKALLTALKKVRAGGATALYDSILMGLDLLQGKSRPALVVFTDGVDANYNDTGPGSKATQEEVLAGVHGAGIPIFTIGFGEKSDVDTLRRIASLGGGAYYRARDLEDLQLIFNRIVRDLGSRYRVVFKRPGKARIGDVPVISLVVDNSGSMDESPENEGCDYRIEKVRQTLRSFVSNLPKKFLTQVMTFTDECTVRQVLTGDKNALVRALSLMQAGGGTDILNSVRTALLTLKTVPSTRRYLVYLTDAALKVDEEQQKEFDVLLGQLKDIRIRCLWLGMVDEDKGGAFAHAAERTGGRFVISTRPKEVARVFRELSSSLREKTREKGKNSFRVVLSHHSPDGENTLYSAAREVDFPEAAAGGEIAAPEAITWRAGPPLRPYDAEIARFVSGEDRMGLEVRVTKRISLNFSAANKAVRFRLKEALFLSRLRGIDAPSRFRYLALTMSLQNILPSQRVAVYPDGSNHPAAWIKGSGEPLRYENRVPTYLISDLKRHLFLRWNNERSYPVSEVTWLAESPLILPGETALAVEPGNTVAGTILFMVPSGNMRQASLHFYDTRYGHIDLPISGIMAPKGKGALERLPTSKPARLSDTFSFRVTGYEDLTKIDTVEAGDDCLFRVIREVFTSKVQAHLDIHPAERFLLRFPTPNGSFFFRLHPVSDRIPLGYYRPTLLTPGSSNPVRLVFRIPRELADTGIKGEIVVDLKGGSVSVPVGGPLPADRLPGKPDAEGEGVEVLVHRAGPTEDISDLGSRLVAVEATIRDKGAGGHARVGELVVLKNRDFDPQKADSREKEMERLRHEAAMLSHRSLSNFAVPEIRDVPGVLFPLPAEDTLILGMDGNTVIPRGHTRRGVFLFSLPEGTDPNDWAVGSLVLPNLSKPVGDETVEDESFRITRLAVEDSPGSSFWENVEEKVEELMARRRVLDFKRPGRVRARKIGLEDGAERGEYVPPPAMTFSGDKVLKGLNGLEALQKRISRCKWLPSNGLPWKGRYSPEAVLTQNWGTESDFARLAEVILNRQGIRTERISLKLTKKGRQALARLAGLENISLEECPGLRYRDAEGRERVLVAPFMKEVGELQGLVDYRVKPIKDEEPEKVDLSVEFIVRPKGKSREQQIGEISSALAGGGGKEEAVTVLTASFKVTNISRGGFDIGYTKAPVKGRILYKAVLDGPTGRIITDNDSAVDASSYRVLGCTLEIRTDDGETFRRVMRLKENTDITGVFHTLGINLPDLPGPSLSVLERARVEAGKQTHGRPDALSALRWYARGVLARFVAAQTRYEDDLGKTLGLVLGRTSSGRCLMVTLVKPEGDGPLETTLDLIRPFNEIHRSPDPRAARAFNILSGLAAARFEASALSRNAKGLFEIWDGCPQGTRLMAVDTENREAFLTRLREKKYPESIIRRFTETDRIVLFPSRPALIQGKPRWAWLEIDPKTYRVLSVLDTGAQGAMLESLIGNLYEQATSYLVGALVGIDVSIWSVAAFSLELEDYSEIVKAANKFAEDLGKNFSIGGDSAGMGVGGKPGVNLGRAVQFELDPSGVSMGNNLLGFGNGYNDGVAYYFQRAK